VLIALRDGDRWLQIRRASGVPAAGRVCFPTGMVDPGETLERAVIREAREELGLAVRIVSRFADSPFPEWGEHVYGYEVEVAGGALTPEPAEVAEVMWLTPAEIAAHPDRLRVAEVFAAALV
jgi:NAD+ diphosphatase